MHQYVAFLRAVNVGGTGRLPMSDLRDICHELGYVDVRTYIASGNVAFASDQSARTVKADLEKALHAYAGRPMGVALRTAAQLEAVLAGNPFADQPPARTVAIFLERKPTAATLSAVSGQRNEEIRAGRQELYVYYPDGQAATRLRIAAADTGTARNMNTIRKMAEFARQCGVTRGG